MRIRNPEDFWSGLLFTVTGLAFAIGATNYSFGHSARPGPAYFPFGLGLMLAGLGAVILLRSLASAREPDAMQGPLAWKPLGIVVASIVVFGLALPRLGLAVTLPLQIAVISLAGDEFRWRDVALNAAVLTVGSWLVFHLGLQLTIPIWPAFLD